MAKIIHKKSAVVGKIPATADLDYGELALNYADGKLFYKASNNSIQSFGGTALSTVVRQQFTATAGQTNFTLTYTPGQLDVYLNGVKLVIGTDYTATSGTGFTLAAAASAGDVVDVVAGIIFASSDWQYITNKPTTLNGFGITDGQPLSTNLTSISALTGTSGFLKTNGAGTYSVDANTYITGNQNIVFSGDATGNGTTSVSLTLANSGVTAGTYTKVMVDAKGRVTNGYSLTSADLPTYTGTITSSQVTTALGFTPYNATNPSGYISGNQTITFSGDATGSGATSVALTLANSGVTAGTYGSSTAVPVVVVDAKGRVTSISTQSISGSLTFTGDVTGTGTTGSSTALTLANSGVTAGTYTKTTVDAKGRVTSGTTLSASDIPSLDASKITSGTIDAARLPSYVDDVLEYTNLASFPATGETAKIYVALDTNKTYRWSGSAYIEISASPGTTDSLVEGSTNLYFTNARARSAISVTQNLTYNSTTGVITGPNLSSYLTGNQTITFSGDATGSGATSVALTLANSGVTAGTYTKVTVDAKGRVTTGTTLASADLPTYTGTITSSQVTTALGFTPYNSTNPSGYQTAGNVNAYFGSATTAGTLDWNDVSNTKPGAYGTLLLGSATNGPGGGNYYHPFNLEYNTKDGTGNVTQMAVAYGTPANELYMRGRYTGSWTGWTRYLNSSNYNSYSPTLTGGGASGTWGINVTGTAGSISGYNNPTTAANANTIVYRDGSGHIYGVYGLFTYLNQSGGNSENPSIGQIWTQSTSDNYLRKSTPAHFISQLGLMYYAGVNSGNWQNFTDSVGELRVDQVNDINNGSHSNQPSSVYTYGGVLSWKLTNHSFQLYASHTGDLTFKTQWNNDNYSGWRRILHESNYTSFAPSLTGSGASGTWGISITGNAATASNTSTFGGYGSHRFAGPDSSIRQFYWTNLSAAGTQAKTYEIARIGIDYNDWNMVSPVEIELWETYWSTGLKKKYVVSYGYTQNSNIHLTELSGIGANNFQCRIGTPVQISGDSYYLPVFVDVQYYTYCSVILRTAASYQTTNSSPSTGTTYINLSPSNSNISDFSADSTVTISNTSNIRAGSNTILHAGNYTSYAVPQTDVSTTGGADKVLKTQSNGYLYLNNWIHVNNSGLFSGTNSSHWYPNQGTYGSWQMSGSRNGYNGIEFNVSNGNVVLMINNDSNTSGFHNNSYGWQMRWNNGVGYIHKNAYGGGTAAVILDSVNYTNYITPASDSGPAFSAF